MVAKNLSIKNVPDELVERLKAQAKRNHRSLQGELMALIERQPAAAQPARSLREITEYNRRMGYSSPSESTEVIRQLRDER